MTDEEYNAIYAALACADDEGRLGLVGCTQMMASVGRLRAVDTAVRAVVAALPTSEAEPGVYFFDSYRGSYCPCCVPDLGTGDSLYHHDPTCPLGALVRLVAE